MPPARRALELAYADAFGCELRAPVDAVVLDVMFTIYRFRPGIHSSGRDLVAFPLRCYAFAQGVRRYILLFDNRAFVPRARFWSRNGVAHASSCPIATKSPVDPAATLADVLKIGRIRERIIEWVVDRLCASNFAVPHGKR